jgi:hypothetical protein
MISFFLVLLNRIFISLFFNFIIIIIIVFFYKYVSMKTLKPKTIIKKIQIPAILYIYKKKRVVI